MLNFNFQKISKTPAGFYKKRKEISSYLASLKKSVSEKDYSVPENFLIFPEDLQNSIALTKEWQKLQGFDLVILAGVGGSSLGTEAVYNALKNKKTLKKLMVLDSLNPLFFKKTLEEIKKTKRGRAAIFFISKSGKTFETTANFFAFYPLVKKFRSAVFVVSGQNSVLWQWGLKNNFPVFEIPEKTGGRYSVLSNAGLLPLSVLGVNAKELLIGAKKANQDCLQDNPTKNPALSSALTTFYHYQRGKNVYSNLVFPPDLEYFGKWYVQLMGESLGKDGKGMTPTVTTGTTDFHAIGQLYFDGPHDKLINFIFAKDLGIDYQISNLESFKEVFEGVEGKNIWQLNKIIFEGVKKAYLKKQIPFTETIIDKLDEKPLGYVLQMRMAEIIFLAKMMKVNAFDQPGVELYKQETRKILEK